MMKLSKRDHLVETALGLFCREGFHAVGIDRVLAEAGVAKMTLYKHFRSKDELILAALRRRDELSRNAFMRDVEARADTPRGRLLAMFDWLEDDLCGESFHGCAFTNAAAEFGDPEHPIHRAAAEAKRLTFDYVKSVAAQAGAADADALACQLCLLMNGAVVARQVCSDRCAAGHARGAARLLIDAACPETKNETLQVG